MINIQTRLKEQRHSDRAAYAVERVLLIAGFAIVVILVISWIDKATKDKGAQAAACIEGANTYSTATVGTSQATCTAKQGASLSDASNPSWAENGYAK